MKINILVRHLLQNLRLFMLEGTSKGLFENSQPLLLFWGSEKPHVGFMKPSITSNRSYGVVKTKDLLTQNGFGPTNEQNVRKL